MLNEILTIIADSITNIFHNYVKNEEKNIRGLFNCNNVKIELINKLILKKKRNTCRLK